jgi:histidine triad (HIT) family protein
MECIFCKIAKGEVPSYTIYEDEIAMAFLDTNPDSNGHTLIIPKKHFKDLDDIDEKTITHIMMVAKKVKKILEDKLDIAGVTLVQNNGKPQEIKHFHVHLKPCYEKNGRKAKIENIYKKIMQ